MLTFKRYQELHNKVKVDQSWTDNFVEYSFNLWKHYFKRKNYLFSKMQLFLRDFLRLIVCVRVRVCVSKCRPRVWGETLRGQKTSDPLQLELQEAVSHAVWVLGTESGSLESSKLLSQFSSPSQDLLILSGFLQFLPINFPLDSFL